MPLLSGSRLLAVPATREIKSETDAPRLDLPALCGAGTKRHNDFCARSIRVCGSSFPAGTDLER
jgi:hypothetical protein